MIDIPYSEIHFPDYIKEKIYYLSGFFTPDDKNLSRFAYETLNMIKNIDVLGVEHCFSKNGISEELWVSQYASSNIKIVGLHDFSDDAVRVENPWTHYLKGKKVLVIHPFEKSIISQYKKHEKLSQMIANKEVERHYLAIVDGVIKHDTGTIDAPIGRDANNRQKMAVTDVHGKEAVTHFRVLETFSNHTLVECILETGRTHQIRVHMAYIGHPVSNDPLYGRGKSTEFGQMLHSKSIKFKHPTTGKELFFEVDPPKEFLEKLEKLREN